jgi:uncharacterized protein YndB with AHSA1/START domain
MAMSNKSIVDPPSEREIVSTRVFDAPRGIVFQAFSDPKQLALWWGPKDFTNTIHEFDLRPGGKWRLVLHGPDGTAYPNDKVFTEVVNPERIVFDHLHPTHLFRMTMIYVEQGGKTQLTWRMLFDSAAEMSKLKGFIVDANEENFDRLEAHLAKVTNQKKP